MERRRRRRLRRCVCVSITHINIHSLCISLTTFLSRQCFLVRLVDTPFRLNLNFRAVFSSKGQPSSSAAEPMGDSAVYMLDVHPRGVTLRHPQGGTEALALSWETISRWRASRGVITVVVLTREAGETHQVRVL